MPFQKHFFLLHQKTTQVLLPASIPKQHCIWTVISPRGLARKKLTGHISDEAEGRDLGDLFFFFVLSTFTRCIWRFGGCTGMFPDLREDRKGDRRERDMMKRTIFLFPSVDQISFIFAVPISFQFHSISLLKSPHIRKQFATISYILAMEPDSKPQLQKIQELFLFM